MAITSYFEETIADQDGKATMEVEFGRSSYYSGTELSNGTIGTDSIYLSVDGNNVVMDIPTAKRFVDAVISVGRYHGLIK